MHSTKNRFARLNRQLQDDDDVRKEFTKDSINATALLKGKQFFNVRLCDHFGVFCTTQKIVKSARLTDCPDVSKVIRFKQGGNSLTISCTLYQKQRNRYELKTGRLSDLFSDKNNG